MTQAVDAYLEVGKKKVFAGAMQWPGWCRAGPDEDAALENLAAYGSRYAAAIEAAGSAFAVPTGSDAFQVVERIPGNATTDFGAPGARGEIDDRRLDSGEADRLLTILQACWATFDATATSHAGAELRKGPRGGGREVDKIVAHVLDSEAGYLTSAGGRGKVDEAADPFDEIERLHTAAVDVWNLRLAGEPPPRVPTRGGTLWSLRYYARRSAWHVLDHAWEIEDRVLT